MTVLLFEVVCPCAIIIGPFGCVAIVTKMGNKPDGNGGYAGRNKRDLCRVRSRRDSHLNSDGAFSGSANAVCRSWKPEGRRLAKQQLTIFKLAVIENRFGGRVDGVRFGVLVCL